MTFHPLRFKWPLSVDGEISDLVTTLLHSKRPRIVPAKSLGSSTLIKLRGRHTENKIQTLGLKLPTAASYLGSRRPSTVDRCLLQNNFWVNTAMTRLAPAFQKPLSISVWMQRPPSKMCTRDWENTKDPTGKRAFPKPFSRATNLIRWEQAQPSSSKKLPRLSAKI